MRVISKALIPCLVLLCLAFLLFAERTTAHGAMSGKADDFQVQGTPKMVQLGKQIFAVECARCHRTDSDVTGRAPGLKGLYGKKLTPVLKHPVKDSVIRDHIQKGGPKMPAFKHIIGQAMKSLIAYLKTL